MNKITGRMPQTDGLDENDVIAVVGIGCRFPHSIRGHEDFWQFLNSGQTAISEVPEDRFGMDAFYDTNPDALGRSSTKWGGFLEDIQGFDAGFFEISPREARSMDPQQRILLEVVQEALEDAYLTRQDVQDVQTGVFVGISVSDYGALQRYQRSKIDVYAGTGGALSIAANRISHRFNLHGPSHSVDTACSSSLVAIDQALVSLREGRCDISIAGGVNVLADPGAFIGFSKAGMLSRTGKISTFDKRADGYVRGEGAGVVILKRLADAEAADDRIYARVRASCVNQDGRTPTLTAPNPEAQKAMLGELCRRAGVQPQTVDYVEAHGTGTPIGDPVEANAIGTVFGKTRDTDPVHVGSLKPNIGHLESAAGASGFIKGVLIAHHGQIPPNANFSEPNPAIPFDALNIQVPRSKVTIADTERAPLVVVNSFGFGGTNAGALLEGYRKTQPGARLPKTAKPMDRAIVIPLTGASDVSLRAEAGKLAAALDGGDLKKRSVPDVAAAMARYRTQLTKRVAVVASTRTEAIARLKDVAGDRIPAPVRGQMPFFVKGSAQEGRKITFTFAGQGGQWWAMARRLMHEDEAFATVFDRFDAVFQDITGRSIKSELLRDEADSQINLSRVAQPGIFGVQIGLAAYWAARGVRPDYIVGHSFGEVAAAYVAGALDLESATRLISVRARIHDQLTSDGSMMAVGMSPDAFHALAGRDCGVDIAAFNGPAMITVSGPVTAIEAVQKTVSEARPDVLVRRLATDSAWHSSALEVAEDWFRETLGEVNCKVPATPFISTVSGKLETRLDLDYWWSNLRQPVQYRGAIDLALDLGTGCFVELSPHRILSGLTAGIASDRSAAVTIASSLVREVDDFHALAVATGELFCAGVQIDWPVATGGVPFKGALPTYSWDRQDYWQESEEARNLLYDTKVHPLLGTRNHLPEPVWNNEFTLISDRYLAGHTIDGDTIFPAAGYIEMMLAAGRDALGDGVIELIDIEILAALLIRADDNVIMTTTYDPRSGLVVITSRMRDSSMGWTERARAHMRLTDVAPVSPLAIPEKFDRQIDKATFYEIAAENGFQYSHAFQGISKVQTRGNTGFAEVTAAPDIESDLGRYLAHPGLMDSALQTALALADLSTEGGPSAIYLPVGVKRLRFGGALPARFNTLASFGQADSPREMSSNYAMLDDAGKVLIAVDGFITRRLESHRKAETGDEKKARHFIETYVDHDLPSPEATLEASDWLVISDNPLAAEPLVAAIKAAGGKAGVAPLKTFLDLDKPAIGAAQKRWEAAKDRRCGIVFAEPFTAGGLGPDASGTGVAAHVERMSAALIGIGRYLDSLKEGPLRPELVVLTREARIVPPLEALGVDGLAASAMLGLTRTVSAECAGNRVVGIDCDSGAGMDQVTALIADSGAETEWVLRAGAGLVPRLQTVLPADLPRQRVIVDPTRDPVNFELTMKSPGSINNLYLTQNTMPEPGPGQVLVRTRAVGLNFRDVMAATGLLPAEAEPEPAWLNLGLEYGGTVVSVGKGVSALAAGDRVMAMGTHCLQAFQAVDAGTLIKLPANVSNDDAATIPSAFATALYALRYVARLQKGERILIHLGTGGVGLAAIQIARNIGAEIFATAGSDAKRDYLRKMGIAHVMQSRSLSFADDVMKATNGEGVDVILNALPTSYIEKGVRLLRPFGRFLEIGKRDVYADTPIGMHALRNNISFNVIDLASMGIDRPDILETVFAEVVKAFAAGELKALPVTRFPVSEAAEAFRLMSQAKHIGKVVIGFDDEPVTVAGAAGKVFAARSDENYLITGGSRGFGLSVANWLSERGAGEVTLTSRSGTIDADMEGMAETMRARGTIVTSRRLDVTDGGAVDELIARLAAGERKLAGIVHGAAVIKDAFLSQLSRETIEAVIAPKVAGAWNLHRALVKAGADVDLFVSFSSLAQVIGSIGQANYVAANSFLDGFAFYRRGIGQPALTIDWGALGDTGFVARSDAMVRYLESMGMEPISDAEALRGLDQSVTSDLASVAFARVEWSRVGRAFGDKGVSPRLAPVMSGGREGANPIQTDIAAALPQDWPQIIEGFLIEEVIKVLGITKDEVTLERALNELGFDSLSSIELKNRVEGQLSLSISVGTFLQAQTLKDLAALIVELLVEQARAQTTGAEADDGETPLTEHGGRAPGVFVASLGQRRALAQSLAPMTSDEGRRALECAALIQLDTAIAPAALQNAWQELGKRHPLLGLHCPDGELALGDLTQLVTTSDAQAALGTTLDIGGGELVRACVQNGKQDRLAIGLRVHASVTGPQGLGLALAELAALAAGAKLDPAPEPDTVLDALDARHFEIERPENAADRAYWGAAMSPWPAHLPLAGRQRALAPSGLGLNHGPARQLRFDLPVSVAGPGQGEDAEARLLTGFALALGRLLKAPAVLIERHISRPLDASVGPWELSVPIVLADVAAGFEAGRTRIARQLVHSGHHAEFGTAGCEAEFAAEISAAKAVPGQFGFSFATGTPLPEGEVKASAAGQDQTIEFAGPLTSAHDIHLHIVPAAKGFGVQLIYDETAISQETAKALADDFLALVVPDAGAKKVAVAVVPTASAKVSRKAKSKTASARADKVPAGTDTGRSNGGQSASLATPPVSRPDGDAEIFPVITGTLNHITPLCVPDATRTFADTWNMNLALLIRPGIDARRMSAALESLVARHDTLRTRYRVMDGQWRALVDRQYGGKLHVHDLGGVGRSEMMVALAATASQSFDIERGPLFELHLFKCGKLGDVMLVHLSELVADGWSLALIVDELVQNYLGAGGQRGGGTNYSTLLKATALPDDPVELEAINAYWRSVLEPGVPRAHFGRAAKGLAPGRIGRLAPYRNRRLQFNHEAVGHLQRMSGRLGLNDNALWSAAIMRATALMAGADTVYMRSIHPLRNAASLRDSVAAIGGQLPVRCDVAKTGTFEALAGQMHAHLKVNNEYAYPGLSFDPPATMPDGGPTGQADWQQWAYGRLLPEHLVKTSMAAPLIGGSHGATVSIASFEIEALPMRPYGFTEGDFVLRPLTNSKGVEINLFYDLLGLDAGDVQQLVTRALDDLGLEDRHLIDDETSDIAGHPDDIARFKKGLPPEPHPLVPGTG